MLAVDIAPIGNAWPAEFPRTPLSAREPLQRFGLLADFSPQQAVVVLNSVAHLYLNARRIGFYKWNVVGFR